MINKEAVFTKDLANKTIKVTRGFDAPVHLVWKCWTEGPLLDQWWAPRPYKAETKSMDFRVGGFWLYCMVGPTGDRHWCRVDYSAVTTLKNIASTAGFCDEGGVINHNFPAMHWIQVFQPQGDGTAVDIEIKFDKEADMQTIIQMGFQEGFTAGLSNLDEVLEKHHQKA